MESRRKGPAPATGTGPAENAAARKPLSVQNSAALASVTPLPLRWARALIESADDTIPPYGSAEWSALPDDSRIKVAACVIAAERWRTRRHSFDTVPGSRRSREIQEARKPRPGDYLGGPVPWDCEVGDV
jgi:hypothetical protein